MADPHLTSDPARTPSGDEGLDRELRHRLEPPPAQVERLVRTALAPRDERRSTGRSVLAWGAAAAIVALLLLPFFLPYELPIPGRHDAPAQEPLEPGLASCYAGDGPDGPPPARVRISNLDGALTVSTDAGTRWIVLGDT